jgi:hypothetical protein
MEKGETAAARGLFAALDTLLHYTTYQPQFQKIDAEAPGETAVCRSYSLDRTGMPILALSG